MFDTNILISYLLFSSKRMSEMADYIYNNHTLVLSDLITNEYRSVVKRKFPTRMLNSELMLAKMKYQEVQCNMKMHLPAGMIEDNNDYQILYSAIVAEADILITGDKHFKNVEVPGLIIMTPTEFINRYMYS